MLRTVFIIIRGRPGPVVKAFGLMIARSWVRSPDWTVCVSLNKILYFTMLKSTQLKISTSKSWGVNLEIDRHPIQEGVLHSQLLNVTETGISSGLMSLKARDRL